LCREWRGEGEGRGGWEGKGPNLEKGGGLVGPQRRLQGVAEDSVSGRSEGRVPSQTPFGPSHPPLPCYDPAPHMTRSGVCNAGRCAMQEGGGGVHLHHCSRYRYACSRIVPLYRAHVLRVRPPPITRTTTRTGKWSVLQACEFLASAPTLKPDPGGKSLPNLLLF